MLHFFAVQSLPPPPVFGVPALFASFAAFFGWVLGVAAFLLPNGFLAWRSHQIFGHWTRHFAQWHRRAWWGVTLGALALGVGIMLLVGALPTWQDRWSHWYNSTPAHSAHNANALQWLSQTQMNLAQLLQMSAVVLFLGGLAATAVSLRYMWQTVLVRRKPAAASNEWIVMPSETRAHSDSPFT